MPTMLITGANRGIGFALTEYYVERGWDVLAARRSPESPVPSGAEPVLLESGNDQSLKALRATLGDRPIDLLWNNAGVYLDKGQSLQELSDKDWLRSFEINCIAPVRIAQALADNVARSNYRLMAFTSTKMASLAGNGSGSYAYRSSKTSLNMAVRCLSLELVQQGISCLLLHPGHVRTDMGGEEGAMDVETSAAAMATIIDRVRDEGPLSHNSQYLDIDGTPIAW